MTELGPFVALLWGVEGSGKSAFGLTFPKPLFFMELDLGGFDRAVWRYEPGGDLAGKGMRILRLSVGDNLKQVDWKKYDIVSKPYVIPVQMEKLLGVQAPKGSSAISVRFPRQVMGYKEIWQQIVMDVSAVCQNPIVRTIQPDSSTMLWSICHTGHLQEKQEIQLSQGMKSSDPKFREKLLPVEFPNDRMSSLIYAARGYRKNLVLPHYPRNVYKQKFDRSGELVEYKSDELEPDGFRQAARNSEIVIWVYTEATKGKKGASEIQMRSRITLKCALPGLGAKALGLEIPEPGGYEGLQNLIKLVNGVTEDE